MNVGEFFTSSWARGRARSHFGALGLGLLLCGCAAGSHAFRLNPEQEPEQYRVTCQKRFHFCELEAREQCGGEYHELSRLSNRPEQTLARDSDVSSTGPAKGQANWEGELTVECGRSVPPLRLERSDSAASGLAVAPSAAPLSPQAPTATPGERACVPGVTQACLGPGACKGAQACLETGQGFGPCDCGSPAVVAPQSPSPSPPSAPSLAPSSNPSGAANSGLPRAAVSGATTPKTEPASPAQPSPVSP